MPLGNLLIISPVLVPSIAVSKRISMAEIIRTGGMPVTPAPRLLKKGEKDEKIPRRFSGVELTLDSSFKCSCLNKTGYLPF